MFVHLVASSVKDLKITESDHQFLGEPNFDLGGRDLYRVPDLGFRVIEKGMRAGQSCASQEERKG